MVTITSLDNESISENMIKKQIKTVTISKQTIGNKE